MVTKTNTINVDRVQLGVRMEKKMVRVLKGIAEFCDCSLGELLEEIVLHSFESTSIRGKEGEYCPSPFLKKTQKVIEGLKRIYGMNYGIHDNSSFQERMQKIEQEDQ